jgi:hypothetical protein
MCASLRLELFILVNGFPSLVNNSLSHISLLDFRGIIVEDDENLQSLPEHFTLESMLEYEDLLLV